MYYYWKCSFLGRHLGFVDGELDNFFTDYSMNGQEEVVRQILRSWFNKCPQVATMTNLAKALNSIGRNELATSLSMNSILIICFTN